jgi:integrase
MANMEENLKLVHTRQFDPNEVIESFIKSKYKKENSRAGYRTDIKQFFEIVKGKEVNFLTDKDFEVSLSNFEDFISGLQDRGIKPRTINRKLSAAKGLFRYLQPRVDDFKMKVKIETEFLKSVEAPKFNKEEGSYDALTENEVEFMAELALDEKIKPEEKRLFLLFALDTGLRKEEIQNVEWDSFVLQSDGTYHFQVMGKNDKIYKRSMMSDFYHELTTIKDNNRKTVFSLSDWDIRVLMNNSIEKLEIPKSRNIVCHSIRKTAITNYYYLTNDIIAAKEYAGHESVETTIGYIKSKERNFLGAYSIKKSLDKDILRNKSQEELIRLIESLEDVDTKLKLKSRNMEM